MTQVFKGKNTKSVQVDEKFQVENRNDTEIDT